jgi:hypothetical protein
MKKGLGRGKGGIDTAAIHTEHEHERWQRTAVAAFFRAEARGFVPGKELDDWLAAESEVVMGVTQASTTVAARPNKRTGSKPDPQLAAASSDVAKKKRSGPKRASSSRQSQAGVAHEGGAV